VGKLLDRLDTDAIVFLTLIVGLPAFLALLMAIVSVVALLCGWQPWAR
jgi:hypothetical protein